MCVCVSGNACGYFISHPWEELHLKYGLMWKYNVMCSSLDPMEELTASPPYSSWSRTWAWVICPPPPPTHTHTQTGNPGSITEIECTLLSGCP